MYNLSPSLCTITTVIRERTIGALAAKRSTCLSSWITASLGFIIMVVIIVVVEAEVADRMVMVLPAMLTENQQIIQKVER